MDMERLQDHRDEPTPETARYAAELVQRCGPLVLDGYQYRLNEAGDLEKVPVGLLGAERIAAAEGIETIRFEGV
jgi:hypothetical protein